MSSPHPPKRPLLVTLQLDDASFQFFDALRQTHFPPERNFLSAHITLFHALPGDALDDIWQTLQATCVGQMPFGLTFLKPWFLGRGVAIEIICDELVTLRAALARHWSGWLTPQDRNSYRPHITVQNKVPADQARQLHEAMTRTWTPRVGQGIGLLLWRYEGGPWTLLDTFPFAGTLQN